MGQKYTSLKRSRGNAQSDAAGARPGMQAQASFRRTIDKKKREQDHQWKLFTDLDLQDEKEMLDLAIFLQTLVDFVPGLGRTDSTKYLESDAEDEMLEDDSIRLDQIAIAEVTDNALDGLDGDPNNYMLPKGDITFDVCRTIVQLYKVGGRLSPKSVRKILREAYKLNKTFPNVMECDVSGDTSVTVVGDLHGQLQDLIYILEHSGFPSQKRKYVFNGDFVDRGPDGLEICIILLALQLADPTCVYLNRGNHEDYAICCVYGFQREVKEKYDELTFSMFVEMFRYLPLATVISEKILVIHGGLFHRDGITFDDVNEIDRTDYTPKPTKEELLRVKNFPEEERSFELKQLMRCALWSDPDPDYGVGHNPRGAGVLFGPDVTKQFLTDNGLDMVVRSHECVKDGWDHPYEDEYAGLLGTIFSASNYGGSGNFGAYLKYSMTEPPGDYYVAGESEDAPYKGIPIYYSVHRYNIEDAFDAMNTTSLVKINIFDLVFKKKNELESEFGKFDHGNNGLVTKTDWATVMVNVTGLQVLWISLIPTLVPDEAIEGISNINYRIFLEKFNAHLNKVQNTGEAGSMVNTLYANRQKLQAIFQFFDKDGNGSISREEFQQGCEYINKHVSDSEQIANPDRILEIMDFDGDDNIDLNEFFETFRIMDAKDGHIDGVIDLAQK
mmetsp:Transcript_27526/g.34406  ORF Transcript_27526/g.34406 Transcript_27526/m.34406 type:complete len:670 (-) Transcript_27526:400-2409(-)